MFAFINDVFVCFVGDDQEIALDRERCDLVCFFAGEDNSGRVRRRVEVNRTRVSGSVTSKGRTESLGTSFIRRD